MKVLEWMRGRILIPVVAVSLITINILASSVYRYSKEQASTSEELRILRHGNYAAAARLQHLNEKCRQLGKTITDGRMSSKRWIYTDDLRPRMFFSDKYKLLVSATPKCGTTQWRKLILIIENIVERNAPYGLMKVGTQRYMWKVFDVNKTEERNEIDCRLNDYFKVMTVREPLERLVSAYKDKLQSQNKQDYMNMSKTMHKTFGNGSEGLATFSEFIESILQTKDSSTLNIHWKPYTDLCDPCYVKYDYIAKLETIYDDIAYIGLKLGFDNKIAFDESSGGALQQKWKTDYRAYYQQLNVSKRKAIFEYYKSQYDFFDYPYPDFINGEKH